MDRTRREITKIARTVNTLVIRMMREENIGSSEMDLIHLVRKNPGISQSEIGRCLNMDKGAVAKRVKNLIDKGFLRREPDPADARAKHVFALEKAEAAKATKAMVEAEFYSWLYEDLSEAELAAFTQTLHKLYLKSKAEAEAGFAHVSGRLESEP